MRKMISASARNILISVTSFCLTAGVILNAFYQRKQFYPSVVYITKSNASMAAIYFQGLILMFLAWKVVRWIFFGQLRPSEIEHLVDKSWFALTETCLAFTVFRDEFSSQFVALFTILLFLKCFHWLAEDRIDFMERTPAIPRLFHIRACGLLTFLAFCDSFFVAYAYHSLVTKGVTFQLVFGFEYAILATSVVFITIKYILHCIDIANDQTPWDRKAAILLYSELGVNFVKVCLYAVFLILMLRVHSIPLFAIRPIYMSFKALKKALHDVIMSRRAIHTMNTLFPDVSLEEIRSGDTTCIICREEMVSGCKKLPCNHIFHSHCLRSWFQRQQSCPTCRLDIFRQPQHRPTPVPPQPQQQAQGPNIQQIPNGIFPPPGFFHQNGGPGMAGQFGFGMPQFPHFHPTPPQAAGNAPPAPPPGSGAQQNPFPGFPGMQQFQNNFFPPFMPFMLPVPPVPVPDFTAMSEEELRRLEGDSRRALELRVIHLRNIQALLDAAVIQFTQYLSLMPIQTPNGSSSTQGTQANSPQEPSSSPTEQRNSGEENGDMGRGNNNESDEVRRRRLDRFANV